MLAEQIVYFNIASPSLVAGRGERGSNVGARVSLQEGASLPYAAPLTYFQRLISLINILFCFHQ